MSITHLGTSEAITEGSTALYSCTLTDTAGTAISSGAVSAITATLRDVQTDAVINSRDAQSVLNANGGTLASGGAFSLVLSATDNIQAAGNTRALQARRLTLEVTYDDGAITHEVTYYVRALADIS